MYLQMDRSIPCIIQKKKKTLCLYPVLVTKNKTDLLKENLAIKQPVKSVVVERLKGKCLPQTGGWRKDCFYHKLQNNVDFTDA